MNVRELIEELQAMDPELPVYKRYFDQNGGCCGGSSEMDEIEDISLETTSIRRMAAGPRGGKPQLRNVYSHAVVIS